MLSSDLINDEFSFLFQTQILRLSSQKTAYEKLISEIIITLIVMFQKLNQFYHKHRDILAMFQC